MPNNVFNEDVKLIKRKNGFKKFKITTFLLLIFAFVIMSANVFSSMLTVGSFNFSTLFNNSPYVKISEHYLYSVNMESTTNLTEAQQLAEVLALQGASAFLWKDKNAYDIVGNIYKSKSDAESVFNNLKFTNEKVFIKEIKFNEVKIKYENYTKEQRKVVNNALNYITEITDSLYNYCLNIDKKELSPTTVSSHVNSLKSNCIIIGSTLDVLNSTQIYEETIKIKNAYVKITEVLNELVLKLINTKNINHVVKYSYVELINIKYDLFNNLKK